MLECYDKPPRDVRIIVHPARETISIFTDIVPYIEPHACARLVYIT